ncbi:FAD binding domain-containing protein [Roseovarius aestuariivivens]|uniref:FAD binding domain-containing protein n=1 Tax=Roseovarius aestuariivivens TaxID=1888910 RepID=UPI00108140BC|nr:FAD binding domain-containing protein [Roseovarius aestuariivivens]
MPSYHRPASLDDALNVLAETGAQVAAGCTDLFPATEARALPGQILDITGIADLRAIERNEDGMRIGAGVRWRDMLRGDLPRALDMLVEAAREVGSTQIQAAGTLVGNICNASPAADGMPCLLALDAEVEIASLDGSRHMPLSDFVTGPRRIALRPGELVTGFWLPAAALAGRSRFRKLGARRYLVISIAMVAVRIVEKAGKVSRAALSVGACGPVATRLAAQEAALVGCPVGQMARAVRNDLILPALAPLDDIRADAAYRGTAAAELVRQALADLEHAG